MTLLSGLRRKHHGQLRMECCDRDWIRQMRDRARAISQSLGSVSTDNLRRLVEDGDMPPPVMPQSWGTLLRGKCWVYIGQEMSLHASNHGRRINVYRWME